ncbi:MAG: hypothetical protein F6J93_02850 [Oscillatoria sp. SIO1A7]|nr:hypothetical protein [Oscillatoria sp. SIO1A7]
MPHTNRGNRGDSFADLTVRSGKAPTVFVEQVRQPGQPRSGKAPTVFVEQVRQPGQPRSGKAPTVFVEQVRGFDIKT